MAFIADSWCRAPMGITAASTEVEPAKTRPVVMGADTSVVPRSAKAYGLVRASLAKRARQGDDWPGDKLQLLRATDRKLDQ